MWAQRRLNYNDEMSVTHTYVANLGHPLAVNFTRTTPTVY